MQKNIKKNQISRRRFIGYSASAAALSFTPGIIRAGSFISPLMKPDSTFGGVPIGAITYSFRNMPGTNAEATLEYLVKCGLSHCELMSGPIEESAGAPTVNFREIMAQFPPPPPPPPAENDSTPPPRRRFQMSPEAREAIAAKQAEATEWRINQKSMDPFKKIRQLYNEAGVYIHIVKFDNIGQEEVSDGIRRFPATPARHFWWGVKNVDAHTRNPLLLFLLFGLFLLRYAQRSVRTYPHKSGLEEPRIVILLPSANHPGAVQFRRP